MESKPPSEWLRLLCKSWAERDEEVVAATDDRLMTYKPYLGGLLTSQLLCRLSIYGRETLEFPWMEGNTPPSIDLWKILGVEDEFSRAHIVANIERFCSLYSICGGEPNDSSVPAAASCPIADDPFNSQAITTPADADEPSEANDDTTTKVHHRRVKCALKERDKEAFATRKSEEKADRAASREENRKRKAEKMKRRAEAIKMQREGAIKRVAQLVESTHVPDFSAETATKPNSPPALKQPFMSPAQFAQWPNSAFAAGQLMNQPFIPAQFAHWPSTAPAPAVFAPPPRTRSRRSAIVVSTAADLDQIVTYSNILWAKYNAVAKQHNKKVRWSMVAKEMGINVKVREKYSRMHSRAKMRGFDFVNWGHYRIKDYPQYFVEPLQETFLPDAMDEKAPPSEQKAPNPAEGGGSFPEPVHETEEAIFNLAMEVAGYPSEPTPEFMSAMHSYGSYGGFHYHSLF